MSRKYICRCVVVSISSCKHPQLSPWVSANFHFIDLWNIWKWKKHIRKSLVVWFLPSWLHLFYLLLCFAIFFCARSTCIFNQFIQHFLKDIPTHKEVKGILGEVHHLRSAVNGLLHRSHHTSVHPSICPPVSLVFWCKVNCRDLQLAFTYVNIHIINYNIVFSVFICM